MAEEDEVEIFVVLLGVLGAGLGVLMTVAALASDTYEGRVYLFLPTIILGAIGAAIGTAIDKGLTAAKNIGRPKSTRPLHGHYQSAPAPKPPPKPPPPPRAPSRAAMCLNPGCRRQLPAKARFCGYCGTKIS